jgi:putative component of membrane protein insertase Oxa1/YidC/SpoIIIJ protein YidD
MPEHQKKIRLFFGLSLFFATTGLMFPGCATLQTDRPARTTDPLSAIVHFYRGPLNHLSAVRGGTCAMYPCSSSYSLECLEKHGLLLGWMMTCDRLLRSGRDELYLAPEIVINGKTFSYDPVEANEFWWHSDRSLDIDFGSVENTITWPGTLGGTVSGDDKGGD